MSRSIFSILARSAMPKALIVVVLLTAIPTPAQAFPFVGMLVPALGYLVGRGLVNEARGAARASIADADRMLEERIRQASREGMHGA